MSMTVTHLGHSCLLLEIGTHRVLFDPFIRPNPLAAHIDLGSLRPDHVLVSHGHFDHMADAEEILRQSAATLVANYEIATWFQNKGLPNATVPMNLGGSVSLPFGRVKMVPALHSSVLPDGSHGGAPAGFVIESSEGNFFFSGDTALTLDYQLLGMRHHFHGAALCLGDHFTMGVADAVQAALWIKTATVVGIHFDTFPPIQINHDLAKQAFLDAGITLHLPKPGDCVKLPC